MAGGNSAYDDDGKADKEWRLREIKWKQVLARLDYANFCLTALLIVAAVVVYTTAEPRQVPYLMWDARISYPHHADTVPAWVAAFVPIMAMLLTILLGEFRASRRLHASVTDAASAAVYFFLDGIQSIVAGVLITQVLKVTVGRLRPNFLARCQPVVPDATAAVPIYNLSNVTEGLLPGNQFPCADGSSAEEGRLAFVSGHTSLAFNAAVYASGYLIWCWHWRRPLPSRRLSFRQEFREDLINVLAKAWMLAMLCFAWGVGVSRITDYQHHHSDVVGGAVVGIMIALVYLLRAIPRWRRVLVEPAEGAGNATGRDLTSGDIEAPIAVLPGSAKQRSVAAVALSSSVTAE